MGRASRERRGGHRRACLPERAQGEHSAGEGQRPRTSPLLSAPVGGAEPGRQRGRDPRQPCLAPLRKEGTCCRWRRAQDGDPAWR